MPNRGFTLLELVLALVIAGVVAGLALPGIAALRDRLAVDRAAYDLAAAHNRARFTAIVERRVVLLSLSADSLLIRAVETPADTVTRWRSGGPAVLGVAVTGLPHTLAFTPAGVTLGLANATYRLSRGAALRRVVVSRYGRVRMP